MSATLRQEVERERDRQSERERGRRRRKEKERVRRLLAERSSSSRSVHRGKRSARSANLIEGQALSLLNFLYLFSLSLSLPLFPSRSLACSVHFPVLSIYLPFSRSLSPFSHAVLVCFIFPSFLPRAFRERIRVVVPSVGLSVGRLLDRSVSSCVHACMRAFVSQVRPRAIASTKGLARTNERVNERSRDHRARPPFTTVSFVFCLSLSPFLRLFLASLSLFLSFSLTPYPAHTQCC